MGFAGVPTLDEVLRGSNNRTIEQLIIKTNTYNPIVAVYDHPTTEDAGTSIFEINRLLRRGEFRNLNIGGSKFNTNSTTALLIQSFLATTALQVDTASPLIHTVTMRSTLDGAHDIGNPSKRYRDLYLSGGVVGTSMDVITLDIFDPTKAENASLSRSLTTLLIDSGIGGTTMELAIGGVTHIELNSTVFTFDVDLVPGADGVQDFGSDGSRFAEGFVDELYIEGLAIQDSLHGDPCFSVYDNTDWLFEADESLGVTRKIIHEIPVGAGGAANAPLHHQFTIDGSLEFGLVAETDGAGSYREPVAIIPYVTGAYGAAWGVPPNPSPQGLQNGGMFVAWNTDGGGKSALFIYANGAWRRIDNDP